MLFSKTISLDKGQLARAYLHRTERDMHHTSREGSAHKHKPQEIHGSLTFILHGDTKSRFFVLFFNLKMIKIIVDRLQRWGGGAAVVSTAHPAGLTWAYTADGFRADNQREAQK